MARSLNVAWPKPAFDPEAITVLAAAFDEAWDRLRQSGSEGARQNDLEFREVTRPRLDLYRPAMLLDDDVVTDGKTEPSSFPSRLGRKERVEQLFLNLRRNTGAVIAYPDFDLVTKVLGNDGRAARFRTTDGSFPETMLLLPYEAIGRCDSPTDRRGGDSVAAGAHWARRGRNVRRHDPHRRA